MTRPKVLVTRAWPADTETRLGHLAETTLRHPDTPMTADEFLAAATIYDAILPTVSDSIPAAFYPAAAGRVRLLASYGVGYNHIDVARAREAGIAVTNTPGVLTDCTADLAMGLLLAAARRIGEGERELRAGHWDGWRPTHMIGKKVAGATLGIIGFGRIGQAMAQRAHHGFGMEIVVQNRSALAQDVLDRFGATQVASLDDLMPQCDVLSLHCPGGDSNRHLIDGRRLALMKPGAFVINTARGEVVDEQALAQALSLGDLGGAGLDVFDGEPNIAPVLMSCDKLVMLPHLGSATRETREAMGMRVFDNLVDFFEGRAPRDKVL